MKITPRAALSAPVLLAIILLLVCDCARTAYARSSLRVRAAGNDSDFFVAVDAADCNRVRPFFDSKNITLVPADGTARDPPNTICDGKCCGEEMEKRLKQQARTDFHNLIHHHSRTLQGLLVTTADSLRDSVTDLARQSENTTLIMFHKAYSSMEEPSRPFVKALYQMMVDYVSIANTPDTLQQPLSREMLQEHILDFFTRLFPIAYLKLINPQHHQQDQQEFTNKFKVCLHEAMADIQPFGDIPQEISLAVSKSLEATRVLVQALTLGKTVLEKTDNVLFGPGTRSIQQEACNAAMLRMTYCPKCKGFGNAVMPCNAFCINVMRGCLTEPASELDLAWSGYVETVERLVVAVDGHNDPLGLNAVNAVKQLGTRISDAILRSLENGPRLVEKRWSLVTPPMTINVLIDLVSALENDERSARIDSAELSELDTLAVRPYFVLVTLLETIPHDAHAYQGSVRTACGRSELLPSDEERSPASSDAAAAAKSTAFPGSEMHAAASSSSFHGGSLAHRADDVAHGKGRSQDQKLYLQLGNFLASMVRSRIFYGTLADSICEDYPEKHCWNGERVGEYSKTVVDSSQTAQRYNPEFTITTMSSTAASYDNTNISSFIDQLRHINQMVQSQLASSPDAGAFLGDEALDGSGSGDAPYWRPHGANGGMDDDEDDDDHEDDEASGSGMGPTTTDSSVKTHQNGPADGGSSTILLSFAALVVVCASLIA